MADVIYNSSIKYILINTTAHLGEKEIEMYNIGPRKITFHNKIDMNVREDQTW